MLSTLSAGGWFPIALSAVVFLISSIWFYGRQRKGEYAKEHAQFLEGVLHLPDSRWAHDHTVGLQTMQQTDLP